MAEAGSRKGKQAKGMLRGSTVERRDQRGKGKGPEPLRRAIAECTQPHVQISNLVCDPSRTLEDYLGNETTIDLAYSLLLDHARAEQARSPPVLVKSVALLKKYLFRYYPSVGMLQQIDAFCIEFIAEHKAAVSRPWSLPPAGNMRTLPGAGPSAEASASLLKSLQYVRAVVARHLPADALPLPTDHAIAVLPRDSPRSAADGNTSAWALKRGSPGSHAADWEDVHATTHAMARLIQLPDNPDSYVLPDLLKARWLAGLQTWAPDSRLLDSRSSNRSNLSKFTPGYCSAASLLLGVPARLQEQAGQVLHCDSVTGVTDVVLARSHLRNIAASKRTRNDVFSWRDGEAGQNTLRRRMQRPLFQYRYYREQQPLRLSEADMKELVAAVCSMESSPMVGDVSAQSAAQGRGPWPHGHTAGHPTMQPDPGDIAASVLIKLLVDMYLADPVSATPLAFSLLQSLLECNTTAVRVRAFDLVLNLGVHAHLLEPVTADEALSFHSLGGGGKHDQQDGAGLGSDMAPAHRAFEEWLRGIVCEMLLFLLQIEEKSEQVWSAALSSLLYFTCDHGRVLRAHLMQLDIRVIEALLAVGVQHGWAEGLQTHLTRLLTSSLYSGPTSSAYPRGEIDLRQLERLGGVHYICAQFAASSSGEARRNLFAVLLDYAIEQLRLSALKAGTSPPADDDLACVGAALASIDAQELLVTAFKVSDLPVRPMGAGLAAEITRAPSRHLRDRVQMELFNKVMEVLDHLADEHTRVPAELEPFMAATMASSALSREQQQDEAAWGLLNALLHSARAEDRQIGHAWLLRLLALELPELSMPPSSVPLLDSGVPPRLTSANSSQAVSDVGRVGFWESSNSSSGIERSDVGGKPPSRAVQLTIGLLSSRSSVVRRGYLVVLEGLLLLRCGEVGPTLSPLARQERADSLINLLSSSLWQLLMAKETAGINVLQICSLILSQLCVPGALPTAEVVALASPIVSPGPTRFSQSRSLREAEQLRAAHAVEEYASVARLFLLGRWVASRRALANIPAALLCWPLVQLAPDPRDPLLLATAVGSHGAGGFGGAADVRAAMLLLLVGKCTDSPAVLTELGGLQFFRSLLDDADARIAYFSSTFLLQKMMNELADEYERALHRLVFTAQQSNNEKLLENPYLQVRGLIQVLAEAQG